MKRTDSVTGKKVGRTRIPPLLAHWFGRCGRLVLLPALTLISACSFTLAQQAIKTGPEVGAEIPSFQALDQNGQMQNLKSVMGPKGAMLVFYRSADW